VAVGVRVSATVTGHRRRGVREHDLLLDLPPGEATARQLIVAAVTAEVAAYQARAEEASLVRVLTREMLAEDLASGAVRTGGPWQDTELAAGLAPPAPVEVDAAVDAALLAFGDGIFKVFVADDELADGDPAVPIAEGTALLFLRLVPLAGG
jgi:hypothetical protein